MNLDRPGPSEVVRTVSRASRVLQSVTGSPDGLDARQIADACGVSLAATHHLVRTLEHEGYLVRRGDGRYLAGVPVVDRYRELAAVFHAPDAVEESLRRLATDTGYSHVLGRFVSGRVAVTAVAEGRLSPHLEELVVGSVGAAHATALGKALLATLTAEQRREYLEAHGMDRFTPATITDPGHFEDDLNRYAPSGVYLELGQFKDGVGCAGAVVKGDPDPVHRVVVGCVMPAPDITNTDADTLRQRMGRAADGLAQALKSGYGPGPVTL